MTRRELLTPEQVAEQLGYPLDTVQLAVEEGNLPSVRLRGEYRIPSDQLESWTQKQLEKVENYTPPVGSQSPTGGEPPRAPRTSRPPPGASKAQAGVVTRYIPRPTSFGFIVAEDGTDVYLGGSIIRDLGITTGDVVLFRTVPGRPYPQAREVKLLERTEFKEHRRAASIYQEALDALQQGYHQRARKLFGEAIDSGAFLLVYTTFAVMERDLERQHKALEIVSKGVQVFPRVGLLYHLAASLELEMEKPELAIRWLRAGIQQAPSFCNNHLLLLRTLTSKATVADLEMAVEHAQSLGQYGLPPETFNGLLVRFLRGPSLPQTAYKFFMTVGFDVDLRGLGKEHVDLLVTARQPEYVDTYGLHRRVLARCFVAGKQNLGGVDSFRESWQSADAEERKLNLDIAFAVMDDASSLRQVFYRILADGKDAIVPLDEATLESDKPAAAFREQLNSWLSRRDLYMENFPVSGRQFFGREVEIQGLMRGISEGRNIGVFGLRKVGKTSVLYQLRDKSKQDIVAYVDLQSVPPGVDGTAYLYWSIAREMLRQFRQKHPEACRDVRFRLGSTHAYANIHQPEKRNAAWFDKELRVILGHLAESAPESRAVILIDELERMLPTEESVGFPGFSGFFAHVRGIAQEERGRLVSVVAAANPLICEEAKWNGMDNPVFRYYEELYLPLLDESECQEMITELGNRMAVTYASESLDFIYQQTGGHPFLVRRFCSHALSRYPQRPLRVEKSMLGESIAAFLEQESSIFTEILARLKEDFHLEYDLLLFIVGGVQSKEDLGGLVAEPIDQALRHLMGYQLVTYGEGSYHVKINLLSQWLRNEVEV